MFRRLSVLLVVGLVVAGLVAAAPDARADQSESAERRVAAASIAAGAANTCVLLTTGNVRCWGFGGQGMTGLGNTESIGDDETPANAGNVTLGGRATAIAAGTNHACALLTTGAVRCWGDGIYGQLGYGNTNDVGDDEAPATAGNVPLGGRATAITAGYGHTCALLTTGAVRCWGDNTYGQLGYGNTNDIGDDETPATAGNLPLGARATAITAGESHTCALLRTGAVGCWGRGLVGALGYGNTNDIGDNEAPATAGSVDLGGTATAISTSANHTCALLTAGAVRCWGWGVAGQLGYGNTDHIGDNETPAAAGDVVVGAKATSIATGQLHTCALLTSGAVRCWGYGLYGQLGYGNTENIGDDETPSSAGSVDVGAKITALTAGIEHTCVLDRIGAVHCWGNGFDGRLGYGNTDPIGNDESPEAAGAVPVGARGRVTAPTGIRASATPTHDRRAPYSYRLRGTVTPVGAVADRATCTGRVLVLAKAKRRVVARESVRLGHDCRFETRLKFTARELGTRRPTTVKVPVSYRGSGNLNASATTIRVKVG